MNSPQISAILLAGGRATRLSGQPKPFVTVGGRTLFDIAVSAVTAAGAEQIHAVGEPPAGIDLPSPESVTWMREDPPFTGPAAAIVSALESPIQSEWTIVLACDLPRAEAALALLRDALVLLPSDSDGVCLGDSTSRPQWLTGIYRTSALHRAAASLPDQGRHAPVRHLLDDLAVTVLATDDATARDIDTWQDLADARRACSGTDDHGTRTRPHDEREPS